MDLKTCARCEVEKPTTDFHVRSASPDKLQYNCKECVREMQRHPGGLARGRVSPSERTRREAVVRKAADDLGLGVEHLKRCMRCDTAQPLDGFYKNRRNADGLDEYCAFCRKLQVKRSWDKKQEALREREAEAAEAIRRAEEAEDRAFKAAMLSAGREVTIECPCDRVFQAAPGTVLCPSCAQREED